MFNNTELMLKYNDLRAKMYELKKDKQRRINVNTESFQMCLMHTNGDYRHFRVIEYQQKIIESQIGKGSFEEAKTTISKFHSNAVAMYGEESVQRSKDVFYQGQIEWAKSNHSQAQLNFSAYLDFIRDFYPESSP